MQAAAVFKTLVYWRCCVFLIIYNYFWDFTHVRKIGTYAMARCREGWQRRVKPSARTFLGIEESESQRFLKCRIFAKFRPEKYDFDLCLVEKMAKIDRISKKTISKSPIF